MKGYVKLGMYLVSVIPQGLLDSNGNTVVHRIIQSKAHRSGSVLLSWAQKQLFVVNYANFVVKFRTERLDFSLWKAQLESFNFFEEEARFRFDDYAGRGDEFYGEIYYYFRRASCVRCLLNNNFQMTPATLHRLWITPSVSRNLTPSTTHTATLCS
jgi:hypothetical protein